MSLRAAASPERWYSWAREHAWLADAAFATAVAVVLLPVSLVTIAPAGPRFWWVVLRLSLVAVHAALYVRRAWPVGSFVVVGAALAVQTLAPLAAYRYDSAFLPSAAVFPIALYSLCVYGPPWSRPVGLAVGVAGAALLTVRAVRVFAPGTANVPGGTAAWAFLLGVLLVVVFASWGFARLREVRLAYVELLEERARVAVLEERARIAREMHDVVAHSLAVMVTQAQGAELAAAKTPDRAVAALGTIATTGRSALADMRRLLGVLRAEPSGPGPQPGLADLPELVDRIRAAGLEVRLVETGGPRPVAAAVGLAVYRLVQEALTNTLRHAGPSVRAELCLDWGTRELAVTVTDDGCGPDGPEGHGLVGMRERVGVLGGTLRAGPRPGGGGFEVRAVLPTPDEERP